jgi:hypothetical protein
MVILTTKLREIEGSKRRTSQATVSSFLIEAIIILNGISIISGRLSQYASIYAVILLGDASVGKTCIIQNFAKGTNAMLNYRPTLGIDYVSKNI